MRIVTNDIAVGGTLCASIGDHPLSKMLSKNPKGFFLLVNLRDGTIVRLHFGCNDIPVLDKALDGSPTHCVRGDRPTHFLIIAEAGDCSLQATDCSSRKMAGWTRDGGIGSSTRGRIGIRDATMWFARIRCDGVNHVMISFHEIA